MSGQTTEVNWSDSNLADLSDRGLVSDIVNMLSGRRRAERRRQRLREELVREYIESNSGTPSLNKLRLDKLLKRA